jgi:hypothetical protein
MKIRFRKFASVFTFLTADVHDIYIRLLLLVRIPAAAAAAGTKNKTLTTLPLGRLRSLLGCRSST